MVEIDKDYVFDGPGRARSRLIDLFEGRRQLIIYHFMFDPSWDDGCPSCTAGTDELSPGFFEHLHTRDTSYAMVSRAPLAKLERWKAKQGWDIPWYSSFGTDFNYDFGVTHRRVGRARSSTTSARRPSSRPRAPTSSRRDQPFEMPGRSCFLHVDGARVPHLLAVRPRPRVDRRLVLLPRPHRARPPGGLGGAEGPRPRGPHTPRFATSRPAFRSRS